MADGGGDGAPKKRDPQKKPEFQTWPKRKEAKDCLCQLGGAKRHAAAPRIQAPVFKKAKAEAASFCQPDWKLRRCSVGLGTASG